MLSILPASGKRSKFEIYFQYVKLRDELFISKFSLNYLVAHHLVAFEMLTPVRREHLGFTFHTKPILL